MNTHKIEAAAGRFRSACATLATVLMLMLMPLVDARAQEATFSEAELDQMLAPIALYPDSLLSQVLMASTYPADVREAAAWSKANPDAKGDAAVAKVADKAWEPAVQSLVAFPQLLAMMEAKPDQVQKLGDAFLADPARVMDRVQFLRQKAQQAGNLKSSEQQKVSVTTESNKQIVVIEPAQPQTVYVPVYQPTVVYGPWWYPSYPPFYWPPPPRYYPGGAFVAGFVWGVAVAGIHNSLWGGFGWGRGDVDININRYNNININRKIDIDHKTFVHNPERRGHVPYRDSRSRESYGKKQLAGAKDRDAFRGKDSRDAQRAQADRTLKARDADPAAGRQRLQGADRDKATQAIHGAGRSSPQSAGGSALSGVRNAGTAHADVERGRASRASMAGRAPRGGGHRGR